jgi:hypothetical protein
MIISGRLLQRISNRNLLCIVWLALIMLLAYFWIKFGYDAYLSAIFPGELDYGEGIVWQQAALIPGPRMYGDLQNYPFIVFHYTPLYHLAVHALAALGVPWLTAGRILSTVCAVLLAPLAVGIVLESVHQAQPDLSRHAALASALVAGLLLITFEPIHDWGHLMRVDMLAIVFELLGLFLALVSVRRPSFTYPAALAFVLAVFTRQTVIFGAIATFAVLVMRNSGRALRAGVFAVLVGGLAFAVLTIATNGGFPRHIFLYNVNRFSWLRAYQMFTATVLTYPVDLLIALITATTLFYVYRTRLLRTAPVGYCIVLVYFFLSMGSLVTLGKIGSDANYLVPWLCSCVLLIGFALAEAGSVAEKNARSVPLLVLLSLLILQGVATPVFGDRRVIDPEVRRQYDELIALTRRASKPVFSEELTVLMQAGKEVPWEPSIISELTATGVFDEQKVIGMIQGEAFAFAIVTTSLDNRERYSPAIGDAFKKAYPVERHVGTMLMRMPLNQQGNDGLPR